MALLALSSAACAPAQVEFLERELGLPPYEAEKRAASSDSDSRNAAARQAAASAAQRADNGAQSAARRAADSAAKAQAGRRGKGQGGQR